MIVRTEDRLEVGAEGRGQRAEPEANVANRTAESDGRRVYILPVTNRVRIDPPGGAGLVQPPP